MYGEEDFPNFSKYSLFSYLEGIKKEEQGRYSKQWGMKEAKVIILFEFTNFLLNFNYLWCKYFYNKKI